MKAGKTMLDVEEVISILCSVPWDAHTEGMGKVTFIEVTYIEGRTWYLITSPAPGKLMVRRKKKKRLSFSTQSVRTQF